MTLRLPLAVPLALSLVLTAACSTTPEPGDTKPALTARDYYPLSVGNTWTYRMSPAPEAAATRTIEIVREEGGFFLDNNQPPTKLQARATGVFDGDRFILEDPLEVGHTWMAVPHATAVERYEIVEVGQQVQTPAGTFSNCVTVRAQQEAKSNDGQVATLLILWTYAPSVGMIRLQQLVQIGDKPAKPTLLIELQSYELKAP